VYSVRIYILSTSYALLARGEVGSRQIAVSRKSGASDSPDVRALGVAALPSQS
jgi:hypothetical protein